jgi:hypothetical protein
MILVIIKAVTCRESSWFFLSVLDTWKGRVWSIVPRVENDCVYYYYGFLVPREKSSGPNVHVLPSHQRRAKGIYSSALSLSLLTTKRVIHDL